MQELGVPTLISHGFLVSLRAALTTWGVGRVVRGDGVSEGRCLGKAC